MLLRYRCGLDLAKCVYSTWFSKHIVNYVRYFQIDVLQNTFGTCKQTANAFKLPHMEIINGWWDYPVLAVSNMLLFMVFVTYKRAEQ